MKNGMDIDLDKHPKAKNARKKPVPVTVRFACKAGMIQTQEGSVEYGVGDAICTGVEGEQWPIQRHRFEATYEPMDGQAMGEDGRYVKRPVPVRVLRMDAPFYVETGWGRLEGKAGDWLVEYGPADRGVVSSAIFDKTYELLEGPSA
ncbi:hypothetical protein D6779_02830 [Candidatus Parcubacteria bacterium]|nr:MAG: hypothetical protein D6779_02830 [Candidatus Parcubacteria bacterium]